jgi:hypothetical protein
MLRFKILNLVKSALILITCLIGLNFILKSNDDSKDENVLIYDRRIHREIKIDYNNEPINFPPNGHDLKSKIEKEKFLEKNKIIENQGQGYGKYYENESKPYTIEYIMDVSALRINKLFDILSEKEKNYKPVLASLNVLMFENLINEKEDAALADFAYQKKQFLKVVDKKVSVTNEFVEFLTNMSNYYTYKRPRNKIEKYTVIEVSK